jgi:flavin reductase (DIM6/NTAB) family NADH-FMN oxidoreductase RutF
VPHIDQLDGVWKLGAKYSRYVYSSNEDKIAKSGLAVDDTASDLGPVLAEGIGWLTLRTLGNLDLGGDHTLFIGQVEQVSFNKKYLSSAGTPHGDVHPVMQVTGNIFLTAAKLRTIPYHS